MLTIVFPPLPPPGIDFPVLPALPPASGASWAETVIAVHSDATAQTSNILTNLAMAISLHKSCLFTFKQYFRDDCDNNSLECRLPAFSQPFASFRNSIP
jgi:hypothetical protein